MIKFPYAVSSPAHLDRNLMAISNQVANFKKKDGTDISGVVVYMGDAVLDTGQVEVKIGGGGFSNWYIVLISVEDATSGAFYNVEYNSQEKFTILSSELTDANKVRWVAMGY
jgi:hypothetical protein